MLDDNAVKPQLHFYNKGNCLSAGLVRPSPSVVVPAVSANTIWPSGRSSWPEHSTRAEHILGSIAFRSIR